MHVADIMTTRLATIAMDDRLETIKEIFDQAPFRHLLVVEEGELVGVLTDTDLFQALSPYLGSQTEQLRDVQTLHKRAHQVMTRHPITVSPRMSLQAAASLMLDKGVSCLPVLDNGELVGIVTWKDLLRACINQGCFQG
ncbi:CBS domain-containing protein [Aeromonas simiae]|uniref:CBS domain-containing protein n=1 Tax=Aeromonas simiae TaxID=218936 RepID=A0A5J6WUZ4_9GAMM|nr:CBS domain-containing protein [Aeromonas simiae]QFI54021.1 CBS domain-containing protein [Aeromonas simiae]